MPLFKISFSIGGKNGLLISATTKLIDEIKNRCSALSIPFLFDVNCPEIDFVLVDETETTVSEYLLDSFSGVPVIVYTTSMGKGISPTDLDTMHPCAHKCLNIGKLIAILAYSAW